MKPNSHDVDLNALTAWALAIAIILPTCITVMIWMASGPLHIAWRD